MWLFLESSPPEDVTLLSVQAPGIVADNVAGKVAAVPPLLLMGVAKALKNSALELLVPNSLIVLSRRRPLLVELGMHFPSIGGPL